MYQLFSFISNSVSQSARPYLVLGLITTSFGVCSFSSAQTTTATPAAAPATTYTLPTGGVGSSTGGASQAGSGASAIQMAGAGINVAFGAVMVQPCRADPVKNAINCMMAMQAVMQAGSLFGNSSGSGNAGAAMAGTGTLSGPSYGTSDGNGISGNGLTGTSLGANGAGGTLAGSGTLGTQLAALQSTLGKTGTSVSPDGKTITLADGRQVPASTGSSAADLSGAGFSGSEINSGLSALNEAKAKLADKIQAMKIAGSDGGGGGGGLGGPGDSSGGGRNGPNFAAMMRNMNGNKQKKTSIAGMSKKLGSDNIGVAGDDIFEMVSRRYKARDNLNGFIK